MVTEIEDERSVLARAPDVEIGPVPAGRRSPDSRAAAEDGHRRTLHGPDRGERNVFGAAPREVIATDRQGPVAHVTEVAGDPEQHSVAVGVEPVVHHVTGDLSGLTSVKFEVQGSPTRRFRLVYADIDTLGVLAIGVREEHAIYRLAVERMHLREEERNEGSE